MGRRRGVTFKSLDFMPPVGVDTAVMERLEKPVGMLDLFLVKRKVNLESEICNCGCHKVLKPMEHFDSVTNELVGEKKGKEVRTKIRVFEKRKKKDKQKKYVPPQVGRVIHTKGPCCSFCNKCRNRIVIQFFKKHVRLCNG